MTIAMFHHGCVLAAIVCFPLGAFGAKRIVDWKLLGFAFLAALLY